MKGILQHSLFILSIAVIVVLVRPCCAFASSLLPCSPNCETNSVGMRPTVRKRNEFNYIPEESIIVDDIRKKANSYLIGTSFTLLCKLHVRLLWVQSCFASYLSSILKDQSTVFQISPHNDCYINISVFRI